MKEETKQMIKQGLKEWATIIFILIPLQLTLFIIIASMDCARWFGISMLCLFGAFTLSLFFPQVRKPVCQPIINGIGFLFNLIGKNANHIFVTIIIVGLFIWCVGDIDKIMSANDYFLRTVYQNAIILKVLIALFLNQCWQIIKDKK